MRSCSIKCRGLGPIMFTGRWRLSKCHLGVYWRANCSDVTFPSHLTDIREFSGKWTQAKMVIGSSTGTLADSVSEASCDISQSNEKCFIQMALEMRSKCEKCAVQLTLDGEAFICSYECTFCATCAAAMSVTCPNCRGELLLRPRRNVSDTACPLPG